ncbi:MAG: J domain-containing protein [Bdellovibrionales bacterium]
MRTNDAISILGINENPINEEVLKRAYRAASRKFHPDLNPAGGELMKLVNAAYDTLSSLSFPIANEAEGAATYGDEINKALNKIKHVTTFIIEVCGAWVWVSGPTKEYKDILKGAGFLFSGPKKMWYFRPAQEKRRRFKGESLSIDEIREKYGSHKVKPQFSRSLPFNN